MNSEKIKERTMKKIFLVLAAAALFAACQQPVNEAALSTGVDAPAGSVVITLGGVAAQTAAARTVVPTPPASARAFSWYTVTISGGGATLVKGATAEAAATETAALKTAGLLVVEGLVAGTAYSVTVDAYNTHTTTVTAAAEQDAVVADVTADYLAAQGTVASFTPTAAGPNHAAVTLATITLTSSEKGVFAWDIGYPAEVASGSLRLTPEGGDSSADISLPTSFDGAGGTLEGSAALSAGVYDLSIFLRTSSNEVAQLTERVYIYPGLISTADKDADATFAVAGFGGNLVLAGTVNATHTGSGWTSYPAMRVRVTCANPSYTSAPGDFPVTMLGDTGIWTASLPVSLKDKTLNVRLVVPSGFVATPSVPSDTTTISNLAGKTDGPALSVAVAVAPTLGDGGDYTTLADAINASSAGRADNPFVINVTEDLDLAAVLTIASGKHIKLVSASGATLERTSSATGKLFKVQSGGSLTIGSGITVDGNKGEVGQANNSSLVYVNGGDFTLEDGATLKDNASGGRGGGVYVNDGNFTMKGGTISGNSASYGGGVYVVLGTFTLEGGTVYGSGAGDGLANTASESGAALEKFDGSTAVFGAGGGSVGGVAQDADSAIDSTDETIVGGSGV
jgi:hypothetical protein